MKLLCLAFLPLALVAQDANSVEALVTTDLGSFRFEFAPDKAPKHVEMFLKLAREGYYNGSAFHLTIAHAIIGGGDPLLKNPKTPRAQWGTGGLNLLPTEISSLKHERGTVTSIRIADKLNSDGAQFAICIGPQPPMDGKYSAFGTITEGMDVVEKISLTPADDKNIAQTPVRIQSITLVPKREEPYLKESIDDLRKNVILKTTLGDLKLKMEPDWAPETVRNFLRLVSTGWYGHVAFHRIAKDFVLQGGMSNQRANGAGHYADRWVHPLKGEFRSNVKHVRGIVSMARLADPDSATTSFFLMLGPGENLDGQYAAFGRVVEGLDVLDAYNKEDVDGETPKRRLEIIEARIE